MEEGEGKEWRKGRGGVEEGWRSGGRRGVIHHHSLLFLNPFPHSSPSPTPSWIRPAVSTHTDKDMDSTMISVIAIHLACWCLLLYWWARAPQLPQRRQQQKQQQDTKKATMKTSPIPTITSSPTYHTKICEHRRACKLGSSVA